MGDRLWERVVGAAAAAGELVLPSRCAACHRPGPPLCRACTQTLRTASEGWPALVTLDPAPAGMPACCAAAPFDGPLRMAVTAYKDEERRDLRPALGQLLASALTTSRQPCGTPGGWPTRPASTGVHGRRTSPARSRSRGGGARSSGDRRVCSSTTS